MIRFFDILFSSLGILLFSPFMLIIAILIVLDTNGEVFFRQTRIGKNSKPFRIVKFRTMVNNSENLGQLTVGASDPRVTKVGLTLRKYKIDELPQLWNVLIGEMSLVGPRPEVKKFVDLYSMEQLEILKVAPGITDYASIMYINESQKLLEVENPEDYYIKHILPEKILLNKEYVSNRNFINYFTIIFHTIVKILR